MGQTMARLDEVTAEHTQDLMGAPIPEIEINKLREEVEKLRQQKGKWQAPKTSVVRRRLGLVNTGVEPGPSGMRNGMLISASVGKIMINVVLWERVLVHHISLVRWHRHPD